MSSAKSGPFCLFLHVLKGLVWYAHDTCWPILDACIYVQRYKSKRYVLHEKKNQNDGVMNIFIVDSMSVCGILWYFSRNNFQGLKAQCKKHRH